MMENNTYQDNEERIDQLDHLLFRELGIQQQWRRTFQTWEQRQRQQRRLRLVPFISNAASIAALFIVGVLVQAFVPKLVLDDRLPGVTIENKSAPADGTTDAPVVSEHDSLNAELTAPL